MNTGDGIHDPAATKQFVRQQYQTPDNLNARKTLHENFSTNPRGWMHWYMDQLDLPPGAQVLELGCGTADFWRINLPRLTARFQAALTDLSPGMAREARQSLSAVDERFTWSIVDAQAIPFPDASFDVVMANHMIYHIPDRAQAVREMRRVLREGGKLYAATNGEQHMVTLDSLVSRMAPELMSQVMPVSPSFAATFTLENGPDQLKGAFEDIEVRRYADSLAVTKAQPLVDYVLSMTRYQNTSISPVTIQAFLENIEREIQLHGAIQIKKDAGLLIASA